MGDWGDAMLMSLCVIPEGEKDKASRYKKAAKALARRSVKEFQAPPKCNHVKQTLLKYKMPETLRVGSACSGLYTGGFAMKEHNMPHVTKFVVEKEEELRTFIKENHTVERVLKDCSSASFLKVAGPCDVFEMGFPCQPFSVAGAQQGGKDKRCVHTRLLQYIDQERPRIVIMENVPGLKATKFKRLYTSIIQRLKKMKDDDGKPAYQVQDEIINSVGWVPQERRRVYIVAINLMGRISVPFNWPHPLQKNRRAQIEDVFDEGPQLQTYHDYPLPPTSGEHNQKRNHVKTVLKLIKQYGKMVDKNPATLPVIIDTGSSRVGWQIGKSPTLTASRGSSHGFWTLQHGRDLTLSEMARLQGLDPKAMKVTMPPTKFGKALGNAFTAPVFAAILRKALEAAQANDAGEPVLKKAKKAKKEVLEKGAKA